MTTTKEPVLDPFDSARPSGFMQLILRLKSEHDRLKGRIDALRQASEQLAAFPADGGAFAALETLEKAATELIADLKRHAEWEDGELFPLVLYYFNRKPEPTIRPSLWVLEKDHELALQFFESFLELGATLKAALMTEPGRRDAATAERIKLAADHLTQGCLVLHGHFHMEEQLLFPLAEEILTDIDYLFS